MAIDIPRVAAVCFDIDGTLRDTDDSLAHQITAVLRRLEFLFNGKDVNQISRRWVMAIENPGNYLQGLADRLHIDGLLDSAENQLARLGLFNSTKSDQMVPGVYPMLDQLHAHYHLAVVTARGKRKTLAFLEKFELTAFFSAIATSQTCRYTKPFPDPILWAADQMSVPPEACLMVGDTTVDIRAGRAAGAQTIGVLCGFGERDELQRVGADMILEQTDELTNLLLAKPLID